MNIYAALTINGTPVTGEVSNPGMMISRPNGPAVNVGQNHVEIHGFYQEFAANPGATQRTENLHTFGPIVFTRRIDQASPLFLMAQFQNASVDGVFRFLRPTAGGGQPLNFHTFTVHGGRITAMRTEVLNNLTPEGGQLPELERITLAFRILTVTNLVHNTEFTVEWHGR